MVILITGDRNWINANFVWSVLDLFAAKYGKHKLLVVQGGCKGVDTHAKNWAEKHKVDYVTRWAHWDHYGKPAGPIRNHVMYDDHHPDLVIAFHPELHSGSIGTYEMYQYARRHGTSVKHFTGNETLSELAV
jgi:hypothetical protein